MPAPAADADPPTLRRPDPAALVEALLPTVSRWCAHLGGARVDAEEAASDVMLTLLRRAGDLQPGVPIEVWAYAITRRVVANHRRRAWWRRWLPGAPPETPARGGPLVEVSRAETARKVAALLELLPEAQREVLVLCDVEERSAAEVARLLGVPEGTVRSRTRLARARFRALAPRFGLDGPEEDTP